MSLKINFFCLFFLIFSCTFSQIQINEIFADNGECCFDEYNESEDFIEIINLGLSPVNIAGYFFGDGNGGSIIPSNSPELTTISAGEVMVIWYDKDLDQGLLHVDAKLNNSGEEVIIINADGDTIVDIDFGPQLEDVSYASFPDGSPYSIGWTLSLCPTPGVLNQDCPLIEGCTSFNAINYDSSATVENGTCEFGEFNGLMINEYSASNCDNNGSNCGNYDDWIELYNNSNEAIDLQGYFLSDKIGNIFKWQFPNSTILNPGEHIIIYAGGLDPSLVISDNTTSFKLSQTKTGEYIILADPTGNILDYLQLNRHQLNHSVGRASDASSLWSMFTEPTPNSPNSNSIAYYGYKSAPFFNYEPGFYNNEVVLNLNSNDALVDIYFTLNGDEPNSSSNYYGSIDASGNLSSPNPDIIISNTTVVRAIAISQEGEYLSSFTETNTYFIDASHNMYTISISSSQLESLMGGNQIKPVGTFEVFDAEGVLLDEAVGEFNKHGNDSWAYAQRGLDYITRDQYGYNYAINNPIFRTKNRDSFQRLILKAAANDNYDFAPGSPAHIRDSYIHSLSQVGDLRLDERSHESCALYVNGEYWGCYDVREKVDDADFLDYYYDQGEGHIDFLKTWGGTWVEFGDNNTEDEWDDLVDFITGNDMSNQDNYDYVQSVYNTGSLIDYFILNSYVVAMDWLNWNTGWWRGKNPNGDKKKWRYILWDMDATFGHYVNYTGIPDTGAGADPCDPETLGDPGGQGHVPILNALFDNDNFTADYINRYADLSNTIFSCDFMLGHLDSLINIIAPEMPRQIDRWGGNLQSWENNVQELRDFIIERCSDEFVEGMEECYDVEALDITVIIEGEGEVDVNSVELTPFNSPWTGTYYSGLPISLSANGVGDDLLNFYWEVVDGDVILDDPSNPDIVFDLNSSLTIIANFDVCVPVPSEDIIGPVLVEEGDIWQYTFPSEFTNTSEWVVSGGEIVFTSSSENTIAVQWNYGTGQGQITLTQYNPQGVAECIFLNVNITEAPDNTDVIDEEEPSSQNIFVFPSPATETLSVIVGTSQDFNISLYNIEGKTVFSCVDCNSSMAIDVSGFSPGIYVLFVETKYSNFFKRVAVK